MLVFFRRRRARDDRARHRRDERRLRASRPVRRTLAAVSVATRRRSWPIVVVGVADFVAGPGLHRHRSPSTTRARWLTLAGQRGRQRRDDGLGHVHRLAPRAAVDACVRAPSGPRPSRSCACAQARSTERARIAREMHDVLAHRISQISMQAGALAFRDDLDAEPLRSGLSEIQGQANDGAHRAPRRARRAARGRRRRHAGAAAADVRRHRCAGRRGQAARTQRSPSRTSVRTATEVPPATSVARSTGSSRRASPTPASTPPVPAGHRARRRPRGRHHGHAHQPARLRDHGHPGGRPRPDRAPRAHRAARWPTGGHRGSARPSCCEAWLPWSA